MGTRNSELIFNLLDLHEQIPLTEQKMAGNMAATFYPERNQTEQTASFAQNLKASLRDIGVELIPYKEALNEDGNVRKGVVLIAEGDLPDKKLPIRNVETLYDNPIVGIFDGNLDIPKNPTLQETLDSIVSVLAWHLTHVPVFVQEDKWTICTMNGSIIQCDNPKSPKEDVLHSLVPKLAATVVPPKREEITYREGVLDVEKEGYLPYIDDFMNAATVWRENGLMLAHTEVNDLNYRNRFYKKIVSRYLDHRTGMSYGFLVKQLPTNIEPAQKEKDQPVLGRRFDEAGSPVIESGNDLYVRFNMGDEHWIARLPDVWLLSTRSGCNKTDLNPEKDILRLGLHNGSITLDVPPKSTAKACRPSYDTYAILAHAIGNVLIASVLLAEHPGSEFPAALMQNGLSISHWHGYPDKDFPRDGYVIHGEEKPPVSCSTPQSAAYAFDGKFKAPILFDEATEKFRGDIHIEPHHGTNISGVMSMAESAQWVDRMHKSRTKTPVIQQLQ